MQQHELDYLAYLQRERDKIEAVIERELKRMALESELCIILTRLNMMTGSAARDAFIKAYKDAKKLADV